MVAYNSNELREILLDPQKFAELARFYIEKSSALHATEANDNRFGQFLETGLEMLLAENLRLVFELTESPIETIFVNSLVLDFIKNDPMRLVLLHSVKNAPKQIEAFRHHRLQFSKFMSWYSEKYGKITGVEEYLQREHARGKMDLGELHWLWRHYVFYVLCSLEDAFHMILQPGIPDIRVEGRTVRPDMLIWVPSDESVKIVVECDGFEHHQEKVVFIHDRKRDRALKMGGYEVLRFSGTEIFKDPIAASGDLAEYLLSIGVGASAH